MASPQHIRAIKIDTSNVPKNKKTKKKRVHYSKKDLEDFASKLSDFDRGDIDKVLAKHQLKLKKFSKETEKFLDNVKEKVEAKKAKKTQKRVRFREKTPELIETIERPHTPELQRKYIEPQIKKANHKKQDNNNNNNKNKPSSPPEVRKKERANQLIDEILKEPKPTKQEPKRQEPKNAEPIIRSETPDLKAKVLSKVAKIKEKNQSPKLKIRTYNTNQSLRRVVNQSKTQIAPHTTKGQLKNLYNQLDFHMKHLEREQEHFKKKANSKLMNQIIQRRSEVKRLVDNIERLEKILKPVPKYQEPREKPTIQQHKPRVQIQARPTQIIPNRSQSPKFKAITVKGDTKHLELLNSESLKKELDKKLEKKEQQKKVRKEKEKEILNTNYLDQLAQRKEKYLNTNDQVEEPINIKKPIKKSSYNPKVSQLKINRHPVKGSHRNPHRRKLNSIVEKVVSKVRYQRRRITPSPKPKYVFKESPGDIDFQKNCHQWTSRIVFLPRINSVMMENFYIRNKNIQKYQSNLTFESILLV